MFSIARSKLALPVQFLFLVINGLGLLFGIVYNVNTPDLYVNNAHHSIGWVATWLMTAQVIAGFLFAYSRRGKQSAAPASERRAFLPVSVENMAQHNSHPHSDFCWSGTGRQLSSDASTLNGRDDSPTAVGRQDTFHDLEKPAAQPELEDDEDLELPPQPRQRSRWFKIGRMASVDKYLGARVPRLVSKNVLRIIKLTYNMTDRLILMLAYIAILTGVVTYCGLFVSSP